MNTEKENIDKKGFLETGWKWFVRIFILLFFLFFLITILLQFQPIQNFAAQTITKRLSKKLDSTVEIGEVKFSLRHGVSLQDFLLQEKNGDTLIFAGTFSSTLSSNLLSALNNDIHLDELTFADCQINIKTEAGETQSNLVHILEKLNSNTKKDSQPGKPLNLELNTLNLSRAKVSVVDANTQASNIIELKEGEIQIEELNLETNTFKLSSLFLLEPYIQIRNGESSQVEMSQEIEDIKSSQSKKLSVSLDKLDIQEGWIEISGPNQTKLNSAFSPKNFRVKNLNVGMVDIAYNDDFPILMTISDANFDLDEKIFVKQLDANKIEVKRTSIILSDFNMLSNKSSISQDIEVSFSDISSISDNVLQNRIDANFKQISVATDELLYMFPGINNITQVNVQEVNQISLQGKVNGSGKNLMAKDLELRLGEELDFYGVVHLQNLGNIGSERINMGIDSITTTIPSLRTVFPGINPPENFDKLGTIRYKGRIDGYFSDLVSYGDLTTDIGHIDIDDMFINTQEGIDNASYSGKMQLRDFDLGYWSDNDNFDIVNFGVTVSDGSGLRLTNAQADISAILETFDYMGYQYKGITLTGEIDKNKFDGSLESKDKNLDFVFKGVFEFTDSLPRYDFTADIKKADLQAINLSEDPLAISGDIEVNFFGANLNTLQGEGWANNFSIIDQDTTYSLDSLYLASYMQSDSSFHFELESELANADVKGVFDLRQLHKHFLQIGHRNYPYHLQQLGIATKQDTLSDVDVAFNFDIRDSKNFLDLIGAQGLRIVDTRLQGDMNSKEDILHADIKTPSFIYKSVGLVNFHVDIHNNGSEGYATIESDTTVINANSFKPIKVISQFQKDKINFSVETTELLDPQARLSFSGELLPHDLGYELNVIGDEIVMLGESWQFTKENKFAFGKKQVFIENFVLSDGYRTVSLDDIDGTGIDIRSSNFDVELINPIIDYDKLIFTGLTSSHIQVNNLFDNRYYTGQINIDTFLINQDDFGSMNLDIHYEDDELLDLEFKVAKDNQIFALKGDYNIAKGEINTNLTVNDYPMTFFEYIIPEGISETQGTLDIGASISGPLDDLRMDGDAVVYDGGTKVDYLGAFFAFDKQSVKISEDYFDFTGVVMTDKYGNSGVVTGGLKHDFFADFSLDVNMSSDNFTVLNTTKADNPLYYGFGQGSMSVDFSGTFDRADIRATGKTNKGTKIFFPLYSADSNIDESFITFRQEDTIVVNEVEASFEEEFKLLGLDFELDIELTSDATFQMIFDEKVGEIMEGQGRGDVSVDIKRTGEFDVFGEYVIESGEYLFTAYGFVAKPFVIKEGGRIVWDGDPFDANMSVEAEYAGLRAPLDVFLAEYLASTTNESTRTQAKDRTDVDLELLINGRLYNPEIDFDISFPEVSGELKSYVDSKMNTLRATDNGINNQVVGLLVFRNFLPNNNPLSNTTLSGMASTVSNTATEFFTSQLSLLVEDLIQQGISDNSFIQGVDVSIGLNETTNLYGAEIDEGSNFAPDEVDIHTRTRFKNDKLVLNVGSNYVWDYNAGNYLVGDVVLEWFITDDRRFKFNIYSKFDYDEAVNRRKFRNGFGIRYRKEFGSFSDFKNDINQTVENAIEGASGG